MLAAYHTQAFDDWVDKARKASVWDVMCLVAPAHGLKLKGHKVAGPCPGCGGTDRFSLDARRNSWFCRKLYSGGDAIQLVRHVLSCDFLRAVEEVTGEKPPTGRNGKPVDPAEIEAREAAREAARQKEAAAKAREHEQWRDREVARAAQIWKEGLPIAGSPVETYLARRGVHAATGSRLRFHPKLAYWHPQKGGAHAKIQEGPAMLARMDDGGHHFRGVHCTYLDPGTAKGKAEIAAPDTGKILDAKKMRGAKKGCHIHLAGNPLTALRLYVGEGIETVLSVYCALLEAGRDLSTSLFWTACDLGNLGGPSQASVFHPTLVSTDVRGRVRRVKVPGAQPAWPHDEPILMPPSQVEEVVILGDGDSDRFTTENHMRRAAARWLSDVRRVRHCFAEDDFNSMRMKQLAGQAI